MSAAATKRIVIVSAVLALCVVPMLLTGCGKSDADVAAHNLSVAAEQFEVPRRIVAINGITDKYLLVVEGYCSVETIDSGLVGALEVTCRVKKDGRRKFFKDFIGLSDNVSYTVEQLNPIKVSTSHYRVIFKPEVIIPDFDRP